MITGSYMYVQFCSDYEVQDKFLASRFIKTKYHSSSKKSYNMGNKIFGIGTLDNMTVPIMIMTPKLT